MSKPQAAGMPPSQQRIRERVERGLARRYRAERRFRAYGLVAALSGLLFVAFLFLSIIATGYTAFVQTYVRIDVRFDPELIDPEGNRDAETLRMGDYGGVLKQAIRAQFPEVEGRRELRQLYNLVSEMAAFDLRDRVLDDPALIGQTRELWLIASDDIDQLVKGKIDRALPEGQRVVTDLQLGWLDALAREDRVERRQDARVNLHGRWQMRHRNDGKRSPRKSKSNRRDVPTHDVRQVQRFRDRSTVRQDVQRMMRSDAHDGDDGHAVTQGYPDKPTPPPKFDLVPT
jgi:phosphate transport system permease protein